MESARGTRLDGDGRRELVLGDDSFAYFEDLCYACSPAHLPLVACYTGTRFEDCTRRFPDLDAVLVGPVEDVHGDHRAVHRIDRAVKAWWRLLLIDEPSALREALANSERVDVVEGEGGVGRGRIALLDVAGERVFVLAGRIPELYFAALGTLKNVSVFCPLFSAFGPEPIRQRLERGDARILVTTERQYEKKVAGLLELLPELKYVLLTDAAEDRNATVLSLPRLMAAASVEFTIPPTHPEEMAVLHFTSGTTGMPKGAVHVHNAVLTHFITGRYVLDFHPDDIFWCTADPGWVTGTSYGIIAPLVHGITSVIDEADFDAERWYRILEEQRVTVWYTAPTAIRSLSPINRNPHAAWRRRLKG